MTFISKYHRFHSRWGLRNFFLSISTWELSPLFTLYPGHHPFIISRKLLRIVSLSDILHETKQIT